MAFPRAEHLRYDSFPHGPSGMPAHQHEPGHAARSHRRRSDPLSVAADVHAEMLKADEEFARRLQAKEQEQQDARLALQMQREEQLRARARARSSGPGGADRRRAAPNMPAGQMGMGMPIPMGLMPMMGGAGLHQLMGGAGGGADPRMERASALFNMLAGMQALPAQGGMMRGAGGPVVIRIGPGGVGRVRGDALGDDQYQQLLHRLFMQQQPNRPVGASQTVINAASNVFEINVNRLAPDARTCLICQSDFENGEQARSLACFHFFHKECVDRWLATNKTCPVCRADIEARPASANANANANANAAQHRRQPHPGQNRHPQ